ncbi:MarR family winged helix-turn-helix transcriptional regulator [Alsobacter sp. R-9]
MNQPQGPTFQTTLLVRDSCLCLHAQRAARALARRFDLAMKPAGITSGQFSLMMSLNRPQPAPLGSLVGLLAMDRTTITANLKPLQRRGLVAVERDPRDRRARLLSLTGEGRAVLAQAMPIWTAVHGDIEKDLSDPDRLRADLMRLSSTSR